MSLNFLSRFSLTARTVSSRRAFPTFRQHAHFHTPSRPRWAGVYHTKIAALAPQTRSIASATPTGHGRLQGRVAIVTGAASGLGRAIAFRYSAEGACVICADIRETSKYGASEEETRGTTHDRINEAGGKAVFVSTDVTNPVSMENLIERAVEGFGKVDVFVNNAGVALESTNPQPVWEMPLEMWEKEQMINSTGVFLGTKYAARQMMRQDAVGPNGDRGWIINIASILGHVGTNNMTSYCASKGAVINFSRAAALDCAEHGIHVNSVGPGYTTSSQTELAFGDEKRRAQLQGKHPFRGLGQPDDIARACVFLASDDAQWVSGVYLPVDGCYTAR
ncbi:NAD(P)-binding protein [Hortaea werneckii]|nr:NAD(P)-binding protein [Hortaea werneckii]KAI7354002.1 NAD(P)-binding protein [Hortaea werneckii]